MITGRPKTEERIGEQGGGGGGGSSEHLYVFQMLYINTNAVHHIYLGVQDKLLGKSLVSIENSVPFSYR